LPPGRAWTISLSKGLHETGRNYLPVSISYPFISLSS
jgi:hypothetical protein